MEVAPLSQADGGSNDPRATYVGGTRERRAKELSGAEKVPGDATGHGPRVQLFSGLEQGDQNRVARTARRLRRKRGEFVYMPGDRADAVYFLKEGRIKLSVLAESGKEVAIDIIQPGEIFGEFALIDDSPRSNMAQALDDVLLWGFGKRVFTRLLETGPKLALSYIRMVGDRRRRMERKLSDITSKDVAARICELLHELSASAPDKDDEGGQFVIPLMQRDVASLIGASRQTTTSILNDLQRRHIIELGRGCIRVKCLKELQAHAAALLLAGLQVFFY